MRNYRGPGKQVTRVLDGVTLDVHAREMLCISGQSGAGKTTLLRIMAGLDSDYKGAIQVAGHAFDKAPAWRRDEIRTSCVGLVFQEGYLLHHLSLRDNILFPLRLHRLRKARSRGIASMLDQAASHLFSPDELAEGVLLRKPSDVSGGQRQRAAVLRAGMTGASLILADEPTASLDADSARRVIRFLQNFASDNRAVLIISHDPKVWEASDRVLRLSAGRLHTQERTSLRNGAHHA